MVRDIKDDVKKTLEDSKEAIADKYDDAVDSIKDAGEQASDKSESMGEKVKDALIDAKDKVVECAQSAWDHMPSLKKPEDRIGDDIKRTYDDTKKAIGNKVDDIKDNMS